MRTLYSIGLWVYGLIVSVVGCFYPKARQLRKGQRQALRHIARAADPDKEYVWVHAASLGEFEQGRPIIEEIKRRHPALGVMLTFYSPSGYEARKDYPCADLVAYLPPDSPANARRLLQTVRLSKAIFIKYEFWPNYLHALRRRGVKTYVVAASFRPDQLFFKPWGKWYLDQLRLFEQVVVQDARSLALLRSHGVERSSQAGDPRADRVLARAAQPKKLPEVSSLLSSPQVVVAGSTWPSDEALLADYLKARPQVQLIVAPHEWSRRRGRQLLRMMGEGTVCYSTLADTRPTQVRCLLIDTVGLLPSLYPLGQAAYVGGGFGAGIHNTLEPAAYGVPVVFGPRYEKFQEAKDLIACQAGYSIADGASLRSTLDRLLREGAAAGQAARHYVQSHAGATTRILRQIGL